MEDSGAGGTDRCREEKGTRAGLSWKISGVCGREAAFMEEWARRWEASWGRGGVGLGEKVGEEGRRMPTWSGMSPGGGGGGVSLRVSRDVRLSTLDVYIPLEEVKK